MYYIIRIIRREREGGVRDMTVGVLGTSQNFAFDFYCLKGPGFCFHSVKFG